MKTLPKILTRCTRNDYSTDNKPCSGRYDANGKLIAGCGEPCSFVMQKSGAGKPQFTWKKRLFVGNVMFPGRDWEEA